MKKIIIITALIGTFLMGGLMSDIITEKANAEYRYTGVYSEQELEWLKDFEPKPITKEDIDEILNMDYEDKEFINRITEDEIIEMLIDWQKREYLTMMREKSEVVRNYERIYIDYDDRKDRHGNIRARTVPDESGRWETNEDYDKFKEDREIFRKIGMELYAPDNYTNFDIIWDENYEYLKEDNGSIVFTRDFNEKVENMTKEDAQRILHIIIKAEDYFKYNVTFLHNHEEIEKNANEKFIRKIEQMIESREYTEDAEDAAYDHSMINDCEEDVPYKPYYDENVFEEHIVLKINSKDTKVKGKSKKLDTAPVIINGRTMVPLRFISEELGYEVNWIDETKEIEILKIK